MRNIAIWALMLLSFGLAKAQEGPQLSAEEILSTARLAATLQENELKGHIRKDKSAKVPLSVFLRGENIQFAYQPKGQTWQRFHMRLKKDHYDLFNIQPDGGTKRFSESQLSDAVAGTDLSFEDLAMHFLYWPKAKIEAVEEIKVGLGKSTAWKMRLVNPSPNNGYSLVHVWVDQKSRALVKVVGYNKKGQPLKNFQITKLMKIKNLWTVRQMRVERIKPSNGRVVSITYLNFEKPKKRKLRGIR